MEKKKLIGYYDYTVVLTYVGMLFAFAGILLVIKEHYMNSMVCLMAAGVCDMFDGAIASTKDRNCYEKHFGIQIDSLCDLVSFGVLPGIFVYKFSGEQFIVGCIASLFVLCGLIRLAYFNVQEYERQQLTAEKREVYLGLPITSSAIVLPFAYIAFEEISILGTYVFPIVLVLLGVGYIAGFEIKKPQLVGKIAVILVGLAEAVGLFMISGARFL